MKFFSLLFIFILISTLIFGSVKVKAAPLSNFGGQIVNIFPCPCSGNYILFVRDVRLQMLPLIFQPGITFLYEMYQPRPIVNSLGSFVPALGVCLVPAHSGCAAIPTAGTIMQIGTSLTATPVK